MIKKNRILIIGSASSGADFLFNFLINHPDVIPSLKSKNPLNLTYRYNDNFDKISNYQEKERKKDNFDDVKKKKRKKKITKNDFSRCHKKVKFFSNKINNKNANFVDDNSNEKIEENDLNCFSYIDENDEISIIDKTDFFSIDTSPAEISKLVKNII